MLTVIFGAGASYDALPDIPPVPKTSAIPDHPARMPLANGLFDNREILADVLRRYPQCLPIVPYLRKERVQVEQVLEGLRTEAQRYPERVKQLAAVRYYIRHAIAECNGRWQEASNGVTNYKTLLDQIEMWRGDQTVALVTFNYDSMLEAALVDRGLVIFGLGDYVRGPYKLFKVHGSIDWMRDVGGHLAPMVPLDLDDAPENIEHASEAALGEIRYGYGATVVVEGRAFRPRAIPAIAVPVQAKTDFECPPLHIHALRECLSATTKLVTVGWRGMEDHFLELLRQEIGARVVSVLAVANGSGEASSTLKVLTEKAGLQGPKIASPSTFTRFVVSRALDKFLAD